MRTTMKITFSLMLVLVALSVPSPGYAGSPLLPHPCWGDTPSESLRLFCDNFNSGQADRWSPDGGIWSVVDGQYLGQGLFGTPSPCGFPTNQALIQTFKARNLELRLDMTSLEQVDKLIVLRSADSDNQIELNFRAERPGAFPADLIVQERVNCQFILHTPEFAVLLPPHQVGQTIHVRVRLLDQHLRVWVDKILVLDQAFPFAVRTGQVGLGLIEGGLTAFDNVKVLVIR